MTARYRSIRLEMFCRKGVLITKGKHLCQRFFFNKVAGLPATYQKIDPGTGLFLLSPVAASESTYLGLFMLNTGSIFYCSIRLHFFCSYLIFL